MTDIVERLRRAINLEFDRTRFSWGFVCGWAIAWIFAAFWSRVLSGGLWIRWPT
jgi:hypothetical protein